MGRSTINHPVPSHLRDRIRVIAQADVGFRGHAKTIGPAGCETANGREGRRCRGRHKKVAAETVVHLHLISADWGAGVLHGGIPPEGTECGLIYQLLSERNSEFPSLVLHVVCSVEEPPVHIMMIVGLCRTTHVSKVILVGNMAGFLWDEVIISVGKNCKEVIIRSVGRSDHRSRGFWVPSPPISGISRRKTEKIFGFFVRPPAPGIGGLETQNPPRGDHPT